MPVLITCKFERDMIKNNREKGLDIVFPIMSQWALSVAMETRVLIQSTPNLMQPFPHPNNASHKI